MLTLVYMQFGLYSSTVTDTCVAYILSVCALKLTIIQNYRWQHILVGRVWMVRCHQVSATKTSAALLPTNPV